MTFGIKQTIIIATLGLFGLFCTVYGESRVKVGIRGGFNLSSTWGDDLDEHGGEVHPGFNAGVLVPVIMNKFFIFEPAVQFTVKGAEWTDTTDYDDNITRNYMSFYYAEIPLVFKFMFQTKGIVRPFLSLGVAAGIRIRAYEKRTDDTFEGTGFSRAPRNRNSVVRIIDPAGAAGCGVHIWVRRGYFELAARGFLSLLTHHTPKDLPSGTSLDDIEKQDRWLYQDLDKKNWSGTLSVAYVFDLEKKKSLW